MKRINMKMKRYLLSLIPFQIKKCDKLINELNLVKYGKPTSLSKYSRLATIYNGEIKRRI